MKKKKNGIGFFVLMVFFCLILIVMSAVLTVLCFQMQAEVKESAEKINELQQKTDSLIEKIDSMQQTETVLPPSPAEEQAAETAGQTQNFGGNADGGELAPAELEEGSGAASVDALSPGEIIPAENISVLSMDNYFKAYEITEGDEIYNRILGKSYQINDSVALADLRYMKVIHYNFNGEIQVGELIVNANLVGDFSSAFQQLFEHKYQIHSMYLVDNYWTGDAVSTDVASIDVNNTSCFNYRVKTGGESLSLHAYGCAIDINPQQNPYVWYEGDSLVCAHDNAVEYLDRTSGAAHMITHEDLCYQIFTGLGFTWGGDWDSPKDFQHFEKNIF